MNISQAKQQIANAMQVYFSRDEFGCFRIPAEQQRPVFLIGAPGIGKTAIMQQIAQEMGVCLVSYSMTHHTRQSALGLPLIVHKTYGGAEHTVTEYTMSEIIASVYDTMEATGCKEGILFLDEINCVSETLTPTMLQFLQNKMFGKHKVPDGWIVVTAGNPPEYNRSVREFDIVTWDRVKRIDVEPDFDAWKEYALQKGVHASVMTYLSSKKDYLYHMETTVNGKAFVTPRGWVDLSEMIIYYEELNIPVDKDLIAQYVQSPDIAEDFSIYYDLFHKYRSDYQIDSILSGTEDQVIRDRAAKADFDERFSLIGLLLDSVSADVRCVMEQEELLSSLLAELRQVKAGDSLENAYVRANKQYECDARRGILSPQQRRIRQGMMAFLKKHQRECSDFVNIKGDFDAKVSDMKQNAARCRGMLEQLILFAEQVWQDGQEILLLVSEMTYNTHIARFISRYGCDGYDRHSKKMMFHERQAEIIRQMDQMELL